jgi:hypothetical protein
VKNCIKFAVAISIGLFFSVASSNAIILNFQGLTASQIQFSGGDFFFTPTNTYQFGISSVTNGVGDSVGLDGGVLPGGPFAIGSITTSNITLGPFSLELQTAPVIGTGTLFITDTNGLNLTGAIQWDNITTESVVGDSSGTIDLSGTINLTGIHYLGLNSDLSALAAAGEAIDTVTFQFTSDQTLSSLAASGGIGTSYSGSIDAVPEPGSLSLMGAGLSGLLSLRFLRKRQ